MLCGKKMQKRTEGIAKPFGFGIGRMFLGVFTPRTARGTNILLAGCVSTLYGVLRHPHEVHIKQPPRSTTQGMVAALRRGRRCPLPYGRLFSSRPTESHAKIYTKPEEHRCRASGGRGYAPRGILPMPNPTGLAMLPYLVAVGARIARL